MHYNCGNNNPSYKDGRTLKIKYCIDCSKELSRPSWSKPTIRCRSCNNKLRWQNQDYKIKTRNKISDTKLRLGLHKLELNPNWQGGKSFEEYGYEFNNNLKEEIRQRDGYICQNPTCGITEEEHIIVFGERLTIHHIDYNKFNNLKNNLITLCHACNCRANFSRNDWEKLYGEKINACYLRC